MSSLGSEFDNFLLAPIGEDNIAMQLSVLSALARLDVDPWEEAATLARLPGDTATRRLASLIAALPAGPSARPDSATIAARLIPLLPRRVGSNVPSRPTLPGVETVTRSALMTYLIFYVTFTLFMLAAAGSEQAPRRRRGLTALLHCRPAWSPHSLPRQAPVKDNQWLENGI